MRNSATGHLIRIGAGAALVLLVIWGLRVIWLSAVVEIVRGRIGGDFYYAIELQRASPETIIYGPLVSAELWLAERAPSLLTFQAFAFANIALVASAFVLTALAARLRGLALLAALAAWTAHEKLYVALLTVANPEILELLFLSVAWFAASRGRRIAEGIGIALAWQTKVIPAIFAAMLIGRRDFRALAAVMSTLAVIVVLVAFGKGIGPLTAAAWALLPFGRYGASAQGFAAVASPMVDSPYVAGLPSAIARLIVGGEFRPDWPASSLSALYVSAQWVTIVTGIALLVLASYAVRRLGRSPEAPSMRTALGYGLFFAVMPIVSLAAHPHTFVFVMPVWTAVIAALWTDSSRTRSLWFGGGFAFCWMLTGFPGLPTMADRLLHTRLSLVWATIEPIWSTLLLEILLLAYVCVRSSGLRPATTTRSERSDGLP